MAITEHNWLDQKGVQIVKKIMLDIIANNLVKKSFTNVLDENSDNKHRLSVDILNSLLETLNRKLDNLATSEESTNKYFTEFNITPIIFFEGNPNNKFTNPSDDFIYVQINDISKETNSIWLYQKVKYVDIQNTFKLDNNGNLIININGDNPDISFSISAEGDLLLTTSEEYNNFQIIGDDLYFTYDIDHPNGIDINNERYEWICIGKQYYDIDNYWKKDNLEELKNALYAGNIEYEFTTINENHISEKVNSVFND